MPPSLSLGRAMRVCVAGGPPPGPGDTEHTDSDAGLDTAAPGRPLGSRVSPPQTRDPRPPPAAAAGPDLLETSAGATTPLQHEAAASRPRPGTSGVTERGAGAALSTRSPSETPTRCAVCGAHPDLRPGARGSVRRAGWGPRGPTAVLGRWPPHPSGKQTAQALSSAGVSVSLQPAVGLVLTAVCFRFHLVFNLTFSDHDEPGHPRVSG